MNKLSDKEVVAFIKRYRKGEASRYVKLYDGGGLFLTMTKAGTAVWRLMYRHGGTAGTYSIGVYGSEPPAVTLMAAREERDKAKSWLLKGRDPVQSRKLERAKETTASADTFEAVAREWLKERRSEWTAVHYKKSARALERDVFPKLGALPVREVSAPLIVEVVKKVTKRGAHDTASKLLQHIRCVFDYARGVGKREGDDNPAARLGQVALGKRPTAKKQPALLSWPELGAVLRRAQAASITPAVHMAHRLCAFTGARISNVVQAQWPEFALDGDTPTWTIPRDQMKVKERDHDHTIILGRHIADELREWKKQGTGKELVFPTNSPKAKKGYVSREAIEKVYRVTLGLADKHTPHGWRSALTTLAKEDGKFSRDVVELAMDHIHDNEVVRSYDRGERRDERIKLMRWWDEQLTKAQRGAEVVPLHAAA